MIRQFFLLFILMTVFVPASRADLYQYAHIANPRYEFMAQQAKQYMSNVFQFRQFRGYYAQTRQYDPIGDQTVRQLQTYAYQALNAEGSVQNEALMNYNELLFQHLANLQVVVFALAMSGDNSQFGNPVFFRWLRDGIVLSIMRSGDGKSLNGAYDTITMAEENVIFNQLGLKHIATISAHEGYYYYNMHDVQALRTGQNSTLFVNTTIPMRFLEQIQHNVGRVAIPRQ